MNEKVFVQRGKPVDKDTLDQMSLYASMRKNSEGSLKKAAIIYDSDPVTTIDYIAMSALKGLFERPVNNGKE